MAEFLQTACADMKRAALTFIGIFLSLQISLALSEPGAGSEVHKTANQEFFISDIFLRRLPGPDHSFHFEACDRTLRSCRTVTRNISSSEIKTEQSLLEREIRYRFRRAYPIGTVLFSQDSLCAQAGIIIAAVPGLAGGAMVCLGPQQKIQVTELPLNIQALDRLGHELGSATEVVAKGEDGEVYVANLDLMIKYLKNRYPLEGAAPGLNLKMESGRAPSARP